MCKPVTYEMGNNDPVTGTYSGLSGIDCEVEIAFPITPHSDGVIKRLGNVMGISYRDTFKGSRSIRGTIIATQFNEALSIGGLVRKHGNSFQLKLKHDGKPVMIFAFCRLEEESYGIGVDDIVTEHNYTFTAATIDEAPEIDDR